MNILTGVPPARPADASRARADEVLLRQLADSAAPQRPPARDRAGARAGWRLIPVAALGLALTAGLGVASDRRPASREDSLISVTRTTTSIRVTLKRPFADSDAIRDAMRAKGVKTMVGFEPSSPSRVGRIARLGIVSAYDVRTEDLPHGALLLEFSRAADDNRAIILIGRAARPAEKYLMVAPPQAPGEVLHCHPILSGTVKHALKVADQLSLEISWFGPAGTRYSSARVPRDWYVVDLQSVAAGQLTASIAPHEPSPGGAHPALTLPADC